MSNCPPSDNTLISDCWTVTHNTSKHFMVFTHGSKDFLTKNFSSFIAPFDWKAKLLIDEYINWAVYNFKNSPKDLAAQKMRRILYSLFYLIRIMTRDLDQPFVSKLLIICKSCINLKSVFLGEEYNCIKYVSSNLCPWSVINQNHLINKSGHAIMIFINYGSGTQFQETYFNTGGYLRRLL